jgi:hypothetical protein
MRTILRVSETGIGSSELVAEVGLLEVEENCVSHTVENMDRMVSDLQV